MVLTWGLDLMERSGKLTTLGVEVHLVFSVFRTWIIVTALIGVSSTAYSERVGFEFATMLLGKEEDIIPLFGINVPANSPVSGTFAYDTTAIGVEGPEPGSRDFPQQISGGFSLRIGTAIYLSASEYIVEVINDFDNEGEIVDVFSVQFARPIKMAADPVLLLNNEPFAGTGFMHVMFIWPGETFDDAMEPQLTPDRPILHEGDRGSLGFVGEKGGQGFIAPIVTAVPPMAGDYNRNGSVDLDDYAEWKATFGSIGHGLPADGNTSQIVDAADYTLWRDNAGVFEAIESGTNQGVPEPTSLAIAAVTATLISLRRRDKASTLGCLVSVDLFSHVEKSWHHTS
jgi:hypothetical protein